MRIAYWVTKATNTYTEYVIIIAFRLHQWLRERASLSCYSSLPVLFNPLNAKLNHICHLLALLGSHHILHVSSIRVKYIKNIFCVRLIIYCFILVYLCTWMWRHVVRTVHRSQYVIGSIAGNSRSQIETLLRHLPRRTDEKHGRTSGQHIFRLEFERGISQTQIRSLTTTPSCSVHDLCHKNINFVSVTAIISERFWHLSGTFDFQLQIAGELRQVRW